MMRPFFCLLILSTTLYADPGSLEQQAQSAWQERARPGKTEEAIKIWGQAVQAEPNRADLWTALAKAMGRALRHAKDANEKRGWADRAKEAAMHAIQKDPKSSQAYTAYGEALGQWAEAHKGVHSLKAVRQAVGALQKAIALDPKNAYAHMLLASFYRESPSVISVGNKSKALEEAERAVETGPSYAINHLVLAKCLLDLDRKADGITQLQAVLNLKAPEDAIPETHADQETARKMLQDFGVTPTDIPCGQQGGSCSEQNHS